MKRSYVKPHTACWELTCSQHLMVTSEQEELPTTLYDDETADGDESLSRKESYDLWADDDDLNEDY